MKIIITGTTGYVGEGVMLSCLDNPEVEKVLSVSRRPCGHVHPCGGTKVRNASRKCSMHSGQCILSSSSSACGTE